MDLSIFQGENRWIAELFVVVFLVLLADFLQRRILNRLAKRLQKTANPWDDALLAAIRRPLSLLIWVLGLSYAAELAARQTAATVFELIEPAREVLVIVILAWFLVRFIRQVEINIVELRKTRGEPVDVTTLDAIAKLLRLSVMITAALVILQTLGFSIAGVPAALVLGLVTFGFSFVRVPPLVWGPAVGWLVWQGDYGMAVFLGIGGMFVISGVDNILKPYLISRGGNLPLVVVLLGVFGGILAFGFMGLFLGPTLLAVAYSLLSDWLVKEVPEAAKKEAILPRPEHHP